MVLTSLLEIIYALILLLLLCKKQDIKYIKYILKYFS